MRKYKCILDCDPGHDDALNIMLAGKASNLDVIGITTVSGNQTIEKVTNNALQIIDYLGLDIKVYEGESHPLKKEVKACPEIHGESGLEGFHYQDIKRAKETKDAISFIIEILLTNKDVILIPTGPLTNIAKAILKEPKIKQNIKKIVLMGGSIGNGNITPYAEFNILSDPEAARIVFSSGVAIDMLGLDVTRKCLIDEGTIDEFTLTDTTGTRLFKDLMVPFLKNQREFFGLTGAPLHDPLTLASLIDPSIVTFKKAKVKVHTDNDIYNGKTTVVFNDSSNIRVAVDVDVKKYFSLLKEYLIKYK